MNTVTGLLVLIVVLCAASAFGVWWRRRDGRVRHMRGEGETVGDGDVVRLGADDIGAQLGPRATLVQFSTAFCGPCRAARATLSHVAAGAEGVVHVEIDAESHLELVRRLDVVRTPTTLVLDGSGRVVGRASGAPKPQDVRAALP